MVHLDRVSPRSAPTPKQNIETHFRVKQIRVMSQRSNSHCDGENVAGRRDGHTGDEHHLLAVSVQHAVVRVPRQRKGEGDVYVFVGFSA